MSEHQTLTHSAHQRQADLLDPRFPIGLRGYDRAAVDSYVSDIAAELTRLRAAPQGPPDAVREALDDVGHQTAGILQGAHDAAAVLTQRAHEEAQREVEEARRRATEMLEEAERHVRDLDADTDVVWQERTRIVEDVRALAQELEEVAASALERFGPGERADGEPAPDEPTVVTELPPPGGGPGAAALEDQSAHERG